MSNQKYIRSGSTMSSQAKKLILFACVLSACGLSMVFTVSFWSAMAATTVSCILLSATGCVFEVSKFYALPTFLKFKKQREWGRAAASLGMFLILSFISMLAGIYALQHNLSLNAKTVSEQSAQYQMHLVSVSTQEEKVKNMIALAELDAKAGYRQRAKDTLNKVGQEQERLNELKFELLNYSQPRAEPTVNIPFVTNSAASMLVILLGALLEITTTFLICLFRSKSYIQAKSVAINPKPTSIQNAKYEKAQTVSQPQVRDKYQEIVRRIKGHVLPPTQRAVKNAANVGSKTVAEFFVRMIDEGVLVKSQGNRYKLAQAA